MVSVDLSEIAAIRPIVSDRLIRHIGGRLG
ncbi:Uncharacterised protein [Mycobacteroides abscessus subsp. massiliense]|nr:Uncharacterised protein [Mycobacteroides abscessus subsp. massiliense]